MNPLEIKPGDVLVGRYRVERVLGVGNMGIVLAATHVHMGNRVALKLMLANRAGSKELHERFTREASIASRLRTEHVARVSDMGYLEGGAPYIVMEYLDGQDLGVVLKERGPLPIHEAVDYVLQASEALGEAHAAGIVHRDIKPANLFLTRSVGKIPHIKVLDFGISKFAHANFALTKTTEAIGSPLYMSAEQMNSSRDVDGRSDIWSLSVTLYELIAGPGQTPFLAESMPKLCHRVCLDAPTPLAEFRSDTPAGLWAVLLRAMEKDREKRFRNVLEFATALAPFGSPRSAAYVERVAEALGDAVAPAQPADAVPPGAPSQTWAASQPGAAPVTGAFVPSGAVSTPDAFAPTGAGSTPMVAATVPVGGGPLAAASTTSSAVIRPTAADARPRRGPLVAAIGVAVVAVVVAVVAVVRSRPGPAEPAAAASTIPSAAPSAVPVAPAPSADRSSSPAAELPAVTVAPGPSAAPTAPAKVDATTAPPPKAAPVPRSPVTRSPEPPPRTAPAPHTVNPYER